MQTLAQDLAAYGRNGDSVMVHMNPSEVAGLQALAQSQGTSLTVNPDTGMPEAFNLGDFFLNLLPTAVGVALAPGTMGGSLGIPAALQGAAPIIGGALTGAAIAGAKGEDPLLGGLTGGLGGYGGSGLAGKISSFGQPAATAGSTAGSSFVPTAADVASNPLGFQQAANLNAGLDIAGSSGAQAGIPQIPSTAGSPFQAGFQNVMQNPMDFISQNKLEVGMPVGSALLAGLEPSDIYGKPPKGEEDKYDPYATLNLSGDTGLRLLARGGEVKGYAVGGQLPSYYDMGGNFNTFQSQDTPTPTPQLSQDGYGLGRLNQLAQQQSASRAASDVFAKGGYLDGAGDGMSDSIPATIGGRQPARLADGEFVVPADVVSHLGNGSSKAGAKRLYAMMDKVRHARTGTKKQGKEINPNKYMPV